MPVNRNNGQGNFSIAEDIELQGGYNGRSEWGDFDSDGDLDILLAGKFGGIKVYRNDIGNANTPPRKPQNLRYNCHGKRVTLNWDRSTDAETAQAGLTYNLRVANAAGMEVMPAMADTLSGHRRIVRAGNVGHSTSWTLKLPPGSYRAAVQSIDNCRAGSVFSEAVAFEIQAGDEGQEKMPPVALRPAVGLDVSIQDLLAASAPMRSSKSPTAAETAVDPSRPYSDVEPGDDETQFEVPPDDRSRGTVVSELKIAPNPGDGLFTISAPLTGEGIARLVLYTQQGIKLADWVFDLESNRAFRTNIDLAGYASGIYVLALHHQDVTISGSLVLRQ